MKLVAYLFFLILLVNCSGQKAVKSSCNTDLETNETEVYSVIAKYWLENSTKFKGTDVVINNQTHSLKDDHPEISLENPSHPQKFEAALTEDFQRKNQESVLLNNSLKLSDKFQYLSPETKFYKDNLAKDFINAFPNAAILIGFSRVGFNEDYTKAIIYSYNTFDRGSYFELENQNCKWRIKEERQIWVH